MRYLRYSPAWAINDSLRDKRLEMGTCNSFCGVMGTVNLLGTSARQSGEEGGGESD